MRFTTRIAVYYQHLCFGIASLAAGIYVFFHLNFLDNPEVTPPPPVSHVEHVAFGFADDWWFALLLVIAGLVLIAGVFFNKKTLRTVGMIMIAPIYGALFVAFAVRGLLDFRFNLEWMFAGLALALLMDTAKRG